MRFSLMVAALLAVCGCATYVDVQRDQRPIYSVLDAKPGVGLLEVSVPDDVLARAPNDFSNMTGLISKVMRDYVDGRGEFNADDYTQLGFKAKWQKSQDARVDAPPMRVASLEGVPAGVATPLVTVVRVVDWKTTTETVNNKTVDVAHVQLVMSTWTREGKEVETENISATARAGDMFLHLKAGHDRMVVWYQASDGRKRFNTQPDKRDELFWNALREAVGVHIYPYFPHKVSERHVLVDDEPLKPGVAAALKGNYDEAMSLWKAVSDKDPQAHGALYNQGLVLMVRGDDEGAYTLFKQAQNLKDKFLYEGMVNSVEGRINLRKSIGPGGKVTAGGAPVPKS